MTRSWYILLLLQFAFFGVIVGLSGEIFTNRRDRTSYNDNGDNVNQFTDSVAASSIEWYRFKNTQQLQWQHQQQQQQQQNKARPSSQTHRQKFEETLKIKGNQPDPNLRLDSIFEVGNGFKLFNTTMETGNPVGPHKSITNINNDNNNNHNNHNIHTKSTEQPFKVQRTPDGRLNLVFNEFVFLQKDIDGQGQQRPIEPEQPVILDPLAGGNQTLKCVNSTGKYFCEKVLNYPDLGQLDNALKRELSKFRAFFNVEEVVPESFESRIGGDPNEEYLCKPKMNVVYPEAGETKDSNWLFIVNNYRELKQGVLVEQCRDEGAPCDIIGELPLQYTAYCKQHYSYRPLVAFLNGTFVREYFKMPSCCKCAFVQRPSALRSERSIAVNNEHQLAWQNSTITSGN